MGRSISQAYYEKYKKWDGVQKELQKKFEDFYNLSYLAEGINMKALLTAPEYIDSASRIVYWKKCNNTQARLILEQLGSGRIDRQDVVVWIKSNIPLGRVLKIVKIGE